MRGVQTDLWILSAPNTMRYIGKTRFNLFKRVRFISCYFMVEEAAHNLARHAPAVVVFTLKV